MVLNDEEEDEAPDTLPTEDKLAPTSEDIEADRVEISLNSVVGLTTPHTMKLKGIIKGHEVVVLIDCGATHNFIARELVSKLDLPMEATTSYGVMMGTGSAVRGDGVFKQVNASLGEVEVVEDFLPLELGGQDVILGMQWLSTLGGMSVNWKTLTMKFQLGSVPVTLQGDPGLSKTQVSLRAMIRTLRHEGQGLMVEFGYLGLERDIPVESIPEQVQQLVSAHESLFALPEGLPPSRDREHAIVLRGGAPPVSVRPYRYPQAHKDEIECLVKEMLKPGVIQPSHSPFSSPILLVKKRDGGWQFCIDY